LRPNVCEFLRACDEKLREDLSPHQRRMMTVYKQHASLEICGRWQEIFDPRLTVENPSYVFAGPNRYLTLNTAATIRRFYHSIAAAKSSVRFLEDEEIYLTDSGFMSEALYRIYLPGTTAKLYGHDVLETDGYFVETRWAIVNWRFDADARLVGERIYPAPTADLEQVDEKQFWTTDEASVILHDEIETRWIELGAST